MSTRTRPRHLTPELIISEALDLLEREGYEAFSMRRLSDRLNVTNMAVYRHFDDRAELELAMERAVLDRLRDPGALEGTPTEEIPPLLMERLYEMLLRSPALTELLGRASRPPESVAVGLGEMRPLMEQVGFDEEGARQAAIALGALTFGFALYEHRLDPPGGRRRSRRLSRQIEDFRVALDALWAGLLAER